MHRDLVVIIVQGYSITREIIIMTNKDIAVPKKFKASIALLEAQLKENKEQAQSIDPDAFKRKTPELKPISIFSDAPLEVIRYFMLKYKLVSLKDIGDFAGVSRQRIEFLMNKQRLDIDFSELKKHVKDIVDPPPPPPDVEDLEGEEWLQIEKVDDRIVKGVYFVSNKGRVAKQVVVKVRGVKHLCRKLIMCKPDSNNRIRAGLTFTTAPERANYYVNTLVGQYFVHNPNPDELTVVAYKDDDFSNNDASNLFWESKASSLTRRRKKD